MSRDIHRQGCSNLKTAIKHNLGTKSRPMRSGYLEMFIVDKHRSRLLQEKANLSKRVKQIDAEIAHIDKELAERKSVVEHDIHSIDHRGIAEDKVIENIKSMPLDY